MCPSHLPPPPVRDRLPRPGGLLGDRQSSTVASCAGGAGLPRRRRAEARGRRPSARRSVRQQRLDTGCGRGRVCTRAMPRALLAPPLARGAVRPSIPTYPAQVRARARARALTPGPIPGQKIAICSAVAATLPAGAVEAASPEAVVLAPGGGGRRVGYCRRDRSAARPAPAHTAAAANGYVVQVQVATNGWPKNGVLV
jgi:hypothetical protein